jgi:hypothetical protein
MIAYDYYDAIHDKVLMPRLGRGLTLREMNALVEDAYWLAVRAGVAGRRAERGDVVAELERAEEFARKKAHDHSYDHGFIDGCNSAWVRIDNGLHLGAARRSR